MLAFFFLFFIIFATPSHGLPRASFNVSSTISLLPECAVDCLIEAVAGSSCASTNTTCICTTSSLQNEAARCIRGACTVKQALFTQNITMTACGAPVRNRTAEYNTTALALCIPANLLIVLRLVFKLYRREPFQADDYMILATLVAGVCGTFINIYGVAANGLGRDIWTVAFDQITEFAKFFYLMQLLYFSTINLLKLSMLSFFLRLFPSSACPKAHKVTMAAIVFTALVTCVFLTIGIFPCRPVDFFWKGWNGEHHGRCVNMHAVGWSYAAIGILLDLWMLAIPMSQVRKLNLSAERKVRAGIMFTFGFVITVISIVRLQFLNRYSLDSPNPTWDYFELSKWSTIEITVGIIGVCLPSLRVMLVSMFHCNEWKVVNEEIATPKEQPTQTASCTTC